MGPSPACSPFNSAQNEVSWCISVEYLGRIVLINDAVSHRWRHTSDLWRHGSVTWHVHMIGISTMDTYTTKEPFKSNPPPQETVIITNYVIWGKCEVIQGHWPKWPHGTEWQCGNSTLAMSWPNHVQILSFASMAPRQGAVKHGFVSKIAGGCSSYDVIAPWPDLVNFFFTKSCTRFDP